MTPPDTLPTLLESASGADRELDAAIFLATQRFPERAYHQRMALRPKGTPALSKRDWLIEDRYAPTYTASIDKAMTLVPEGWWVAFDPHFMDDEGVVRFKGYAMRPDWSRWTPHGDWIERIPSQLCATPALALCSASLRAREAGEGR